MEESPAGNNSEDATAAKRSLRIRTKLQKQEPEAAATPTTTPSQNTTTASASKRSSRSRDPEFAAKQKAFLQKVVSATNGSMDTYLNEQTMETNNETSVETSEVPAAAVVGVKRKLSSAAASGKAENAQVDEASSNKRRKSSRNSTSGTDAQNDCYCWICHKEGEVICCETCPRVFHLKCIQLENAPTEDWVCPECVLIMTAENMDTRSRAMRLLTVDQLCVLLRHALARMRTVSGVEPFQKPVDPLQFPAYKDYVFCPMDLSTIEKNIKKKQYGSTEAFLADTKWILHNCIIFNSLASKLTTVAKSLVKICKHEMQEIENCPDCYLNAHARKDSWFVAACRIPHLLVWAKLKGFPFWPAKAMRINSEENVDVRFFGAHDRAWIPLKDVFLYSEEPPVVLKNKKRGNLEGCMHEVDMYIKNITDKFEKFNYAPAKTNLDHKKEDEQIKILYPNCTLPFELGARRRARTYSFSGSERSHTATPTPSEAEAAVLTEDESQTASAMDQTEEEVPQTEVEEDLEQPPELPEKPDLEDEMLTLEDEEAQKVAEEPMPPQTQPEKEPEEEEEEEKKQESEKLEEEQEKEPETEEETAQPAEVIKVASEAKNADQRAAASPPCEVSSTTLNTDDKSKDKVEEESNTKTAVIAETSETVEIEGADPSQDEEEIDDVEPDAENKEEKSSSNKGEDKVIEKEKEKEEEKKEEKVVEKDDEKQKLAASSEEEIDDEEPELVIEEDEDNVERLAASGVSVTVIEKKKKEAEEKGKESIGLSSDISVTVVHKKKVDLGNASTATASTASSGPKISVKKESELLQDPGKKDIVEVTRKQTARKPSIEIETSVASATSAHGGNKLPPDPIVTISKVQSHSSSGPGPGTSLLKSSAPKSASPALSRASSAAAAVSAAQPASSASLNSLASILGQPRMSTAPPVPRFSASVAGGRGNLPNLPRNGSPLMMASSPYRPPTSMAGLPSLHPRPLLGGPASATPPVAGPVSEQLNKVAGKLVDFMRGTLEELFKELSSQGSPEATIKALQIEMEKMQWRHQQELAEVKHNADLLMLELRQSMEAEKQKMINDIKKQADIEKHKAVAETKKKQWCASCGKEAIFYCCWNTSYCDYPCQQAHWPSHMSTCAQNQSNQDEDGPSNDHSESGHDAVQHFLATSQAAANGASSRSNGLGSTASRGIQGNPMMMPFGPQGMSPRMMNQLNISMAAAAAAAAQPPLGGPRGGLGNRLRFPGSYFM